jgi:hypothetical protein
MSDAGEHYPLHLTDARHREAGTSSRTSLMGAKRPELAERRAAGFLCPTVTSRRSFIGTANDSRRPQAAVARPQRLQPESTPRQSFASDPATDRSRPNSEVRIHASRRPVEPKLSFMTAWTSSPAPPVRSAAGR